MSANGTKIGDSQCGPRRLIISAEMPPGAGRKATRSGDGEASAAADIVLTSQNQVSVDCDAKFNLPGIPVLRSTAKE